MDPVPAHEVAIAHDYLTQRGGAERVVLTLARAFPEAPIYTTLFDPEGTYPEFKNLDVRPSRLNAVGILRRQHRAALPLLPAASRSIKVDAEVVIASSSGWAHGFESSGKKLVYCYAPARWVYEPDRYLGADPSKVVAAALKVLTPSLRRWDQRAASTADRYLAISTVTQERIRRVYGLEAPIVPAPHSVNTGDVPPRAPGTRLPDPGYFLVVSRLLPYKNVMPIVQAFASLPEHTLLVVGAGPQKAELRDAATDNVTFLEGLSDGEMAQAYHGCTALVAASHEDFGLTPLEAAAYSKPSAVLRWGGFLDTVVEDETGVFFDVPESASIVEALQRLMSLEWRTEILRARAEEFSETRFIDRVKSHVADLRSGEREKCQ
ncbi:glycosyltransferase [Nocardioides marmotae]|uniref:glycosyltransferase n=1 Tax=Nocardioides marmotae TaxID=2663857 RepID=UPI001C131E61|nr:glycosyltransferase [Nocardioides marmotae]